MKAIVITRFGGPEVLELQEVDRPEPADHELLVRVVASGTNPADAKLRQNASPRRVPSGGWRRSSPLPVPWAVSRAATRRCTASS
ncbi:MAG: hypothetical protein ACYC4J_09315 [Gemmatimonadaceae bacterium]